MLPKPLIWMVFILSTLSGNLQAQQIVAVPGYRLAGTWITSGPDGALWLTDSGATSIGRTNADGAVAEYQVPITGCLPWGEITAELEDLWSA